MLVLIGFSIINALLIVLAKNLVIMLAASPFELAWVWIVFSLSNAPLGCQDEKGFQFTDDADNERIESPGG